MVAEELDVPVGSIELKYGDTAATTRSGPVAAIRTGVQAEYEPLRQAAATARQALLKLASTNLGVPASKLKTFRMVVVNATGNSKSVTYAQLIGNRKFNVSFSATAPVKDPSQFKNHRQVESPTAGNREDRGWARSITCRMYACRTCSTPGAFGPPLRGRRWSKSMASTVEILLVSSRFLSKGKLCPP